MAGVTDPGLAVRPSLLPRSRVGDSDQGDALEGSLLIGIENSSANQAPI